MQAPGLAAGTIAVKTPQIMSGDAESIPPRPKLSHRLEYAAYRMVEEILKRFPLEISDAKGQALGAVGHKF